MKQLLFSILLFAFGCSGGEISLGGNTGAGLKNVEVTMTFTVMATKADDIESAVQDLWIGQYDASGNLLICHYLDNITGNSMTLQLKEAAGCNIYFVANAGDLGKIINFDTYQLAYASGGLSTSEGIPASGNIPLYGSLEDQQVSVSYTPATIELSRLLGHVKLSFTLGAGFGLTVKSVSLCSVPAAIQCKEPTSQASDMSYQTFSKTQLVTGSPAVYEWYVPENKAGTIASNQDGYAADERHKCGGSSVPNATYIEITGDIQVEDITYSDVQFRLYPGDDANDYSIKRNRPYDVNLTLTGIDFSDPRVLLTIPDMVPLLFDALPDQTGSVQITARPGYDWNIALPDWLSATINGVEVDPGSELSHKGPVSVDFTTKSLNLYAEDRELVSVFGDKLSVKQSGSMLSVSVDAGFGLGTGTLTVTIDATEGLPWTVTTNDETNRFTLDKTTGIGSSTISVSATEANSDVELSGVQYQVAVDNTEPVRSEPFLVTQGLVWDGNKLYVGKTSGGDNKLVIEIDSVDAGKMVYYQVPAAMTSCANRYGGTGWRLPTLAELKAMYSYKNALSALSNIHLGTNKTSDGYWSSTPGGSGYQTLLFQTGFTDWYDGRYGMGGTKPILLVSLRPYNRTAQRTANRIISTNITNFNMNKSNLVASLAAELKIPVNRSKKFVDAFTELVVDRLQHGEIIALQGFGTLEPWHQAARAGRNPKTGTSCLIPQRISAKFKPGKYLLEKLNDPK